MGVQLIIITIYRFFDIEIIEFIRSYKVKNREENRMICLYFVIICAYNLSLGFVHEILLQIVENTPKIWENVCRFYPVHNCIIRLYCKYHNHKSIWFFFYTIPVRTVKCTRNEDCILTEACINGGCHHPCAVHNPCAQNAVCVNTNHDTDCSCAEGYQGNGYVGCQPGKGEFDCTLTYKYMVYGWSV